MQRIAWYPLLAVVALVAPIGGQTRAPQTEMPRATVRELATIEGRVDGWVLLPSGRTLIYASERPSSSADRSTFAYDIATKRRTLLGTNMLPASVAPLGDRLAFSRASEDGTGSFLWTIPIDRTTGLATGNAQRVSLRSIDGRALFSPDGKMLVFSAGPRPDRSWDVAVVPATGGAERVVASYPRRVIRQAWSADGQALYVETLGDPRTVIERVPVAGGRSEPLVPRTVISDPEVVGLSPDAHVAFFQFGNPESRFSYRTAAGSEGEISVPLPPHDNAVGYTFTLDSRLRYTTMTHVRHPSVRVVDLATGKARDLLPGVLTSAPIWSPDGRRLAVLSGSPSHRDIIVMNADGSGQRRYPVQLHVSPREANPLERGWSPDGRFVAFLVDDGYGESAQGLAPALRQIAILDLNSGQTRVLKTALGQISPYFRWRADSSAIRAVKTTVVPEGSSSHLSVVEIPLSGPERVLRDISTEAAAARTAVLISDREVVFGAGTGQTIEHYVAPLDGGAARRLPDAGGLIFRGTGTMPIGTQLLIPVAHAPGDLRSIRILSTAGDSTRMLNLPFSIVGSNVLPNARQIVTVGTPTGSDTTHRLFLVPLDGSQPHLIGEIPPVRGLLMPSPDGTLVAYTAEGAVTSTIHEIDFAPALQAIVKR